MFRKLVSYFLDPVLGGIGSRMDALVNRRLRRAALQAKVHPTATLHPTAAIHNHRRDPEAIVVGAHTHVRGELLTFWDNGRIRVGDWCYLGEHSRIWSQASVTIGDYVLISHLVDIHDTDGHPLDWKERRPDIESLLGGIAYRTPTKTISASVVIEDYVWVGFKASILKGVRIGRGAIIAAGTVVTQDVPPLSVVAGNPARIIRSLHEQSELSEQGV